MSYTERADVLRKPQGKGDRKRESHKAMRIRLAHSPDPDDAFMFYAIAQNKISVGDFLFEHIHSDIETLNQAAFMGEYEVTALSLHAYAYVTDKYWLLPSGASIGKDYGPIVVARREIPVSHLNQVTIALPGKYTTAALALSMAIGKFTSTVLPFDRILSAVAEGEVDAGVIIHEGQLTYSEMKLRKILDLGEWWGAKTDLPLPLGVDAVRKDLGLPLAKQLAKILEESIRYAMAHEKDALDYALQFGRGLDRETGRTFVRMYVNDGTLRYSEEDKKAVKLLLEEGFRAGLLPVQPSISFELS